MKFVQPLHSFLKESTSDWRDLKSWKILQKIGYEEIEENKRGNVKIKNSQGKEFILTPTGYIRDPQRYGTSNSIVQNYRYLIKSLNIFEVFFRYFLHKDIKKISTSPPLFKDAMSEIDALLDFYIKEPSLTREQNEFLACYVDGDWSYDAKTGLVNIEGDLKPDKKKNPIISSKKFDMKTLEGLKFGKVSGDFLLSSGSYPTKKFPVKSLDGIVQRVEGDFKCYDLGLTSLEGSPKFVGGNFLCTGNPLRSLKGAPEIIRRRFYCDAFEIPAGEWGVNGWIKTFLNPRVRDKFLVLTLISPEEINQMLENDTEKTIMILKNFWNTPDFAEIRKEIKIPDRYKEEMDTLGDLTDLGF
jgi:hypothetical protein